MEVIVGKEQNNNSHSNSKSQTYQVALFKYFIQQVSNRGH
jgi:hypothetical protein